MSGDSSRCGRWCRTIAASVCSVPIFTKYVSIRKSYMYKSIVEVSMIFHSARQLDYFENVFDVL